DSSGIGGTRGVVLTTSVNTCDNNTSLLSNNGEEFARNKFTVTLTRGIDELKSNSVQGSGDSIWLLGHDLLNGVGGIELDGNCSDRLCQHQAIWDLVHRADM
ncbi:hypothetical protein PENANT_c015G10952, partial [Penicillium antarcticum]